MAIWQIILLVCAGVSLTLLMICLMAWLGPWARLVRQFPFDETVFGRRYVLQSLSTRFPTRLGRLKFDYGGVIIAHCSPEAITIRCWMPLHPPFTIHRGDIPRVEFDKYALNRFLGLRTVTILLEDWEVTFMGKLAQDPFWSNLTGK